MTDTNAKTKSAGDSTVQSGGVNATADQLSVGGDVVGRDKITQANGDVVAGNKFEAAGDIYIHYFYATAPRDQSQPVESARERQRIFISYKRGAQPDEPLALHLYEVLSQQHDVFIDREMVVGANWQQRIQAELETCDFLIPLLSEASAHSEMVEYEISTAHRLGTGRGGSPRVLPIRVAYSAPFDYPLNAYLNHINWTVWNSEADTVRLVDELLIAIKGGELSVADVTAKMSVLQPSEPIDLPRPRAFADPTRLERPDGTMDPESKFYITRPGDEICRREMQRSGATICIKAPRQMGKSSLLLHASAQAQQAGKTARVLDFQLLDDNMLGDPTLFFKGLCHWLAYEFDLDDRVEDFWKRGLGNVQLCTKYVAQYVLKPLSGPVVLALDEVDRMLHSTFYSDFFGMLRSWHNSRRAGNEWQQLDLLLVISTEPYLLIDDLNQSPFNVGEVIRLEDFTRAQVADLNVRHGEPFDETELDQLMILLNGHPFLVRQAMYRVACAECTPQTLFAHATDERSPFGDHLRRHLTRFAGRPELTNAMRQVVMHNTCPDEMLFYRLNGAGLVRREGHKVMPRCGLYALYFRERLT
jgi:hypothetical protein